MALKTKKPAPGHRCGTSETVFAGAFDNPELTAPVARLQAEHLERRFLLPAPIARAVAALHFAEVQS